MKFCTKCGTQLHEEAVVCTKCGCMVAGTPFYPPQSPAPRAYAPQAYVPRPYTAPSPASVKKPQKTKSDGFIKAKDDPSLLLTIFRFACSILTVFALIFLVWSIFEGNVKASLYLNSYDEYFIRSYWDYDDDFFVCAILFAAAASACAIVSFVLTLIEKLCKERLFSAISELIGRGLLLTFTLCVYM